MRCLYINRDSAADRRAHVEANFAATAPAGWELVRIPAIEAAEITDPPAPLTPSERACWLSHRKALASTVQDPDDVFIIEDDTQFSPRAFGLLMRMMAATPACEVLFSEVMPTDLALMAHFARQWPTLAKGGNFLLHDLARTRFAGASAYLVRGTVKARLLAELDDPAHAATPYDIVLSNLARGGRLQARVCFPFLTTPSPDADASQIQVERSRLREATFHAYRRLMFHAVELGERRGELDRVAAAHGDEGAALAGMVFAALISEAFPDSY